MPLELLHLPPPLLEAAFNSLFEMQALGMRFDSVSRVSFNSLFEMHSADGDRRHEEAEGVFQFSI